jgi:uncharacterized membrane protein
MHYLPLSPLFFSFLVGAFIFLFILLQVGLLRSAYMHLGLSPGASTTLLLASLIGSYFNIPIATLPARQVMSGQVISFFGMRYVVPAVVAWPGTIIAVNVGGAVIPTLMSLYLLFRYRLWMRAPLATMLVAVLVHQLAQPVHGVGIALPVFVPGLSAALIALLLARERAAPLAYISGCMGTLIGADLLNLGIIQGLGAPVASIGGAGTFDGIFVTGIIAVLLAGFTAGRVAEPRPHVGRL